MGLTNNQELPNKPEVKDSWSFRKLLNISQITSAISKIFVNPVEILSGYMILIVSLAEIVDRSSWFLRTLTILSLMAFIAERWIKLLSEENKQHEKK